MGNSIIQPSFAGGELAPALYGRVDQGRYAIGLKTCRNFIVQQYGGVKNRPGTRYIASTKHADKRARLIPFAFSTAQTYVLEFGHLYLRVFKDGGQVVLDQVQDLQGRGLPVRLLDPERARSQTDQHRCDVAIDVRGVELMRECIANAHGVAVDSRIGAARCPEPEVAHEGRDVIEPISTTDVVDVEEAGDIVVVDDELRLVEVAVHGPHLAAHRRCREPPDDVGEPITGVGQHGGEHCRMVRSVLDA
jgi:hypothetical protein